MAFASVRSSTLLGVQGKAVDVEIHVGMGLPGFTIVGQPDEACRESRDRVRAALLSCDLPWPNRRITVNLATSVHERKGGAGLDVAIAIGLLIVQEVLPHEVAERYAFIAELGLDGTLRPVAGVVPLVAAIDDRIVVVAHECESEARIAAHNEVVCAQTLAHLVQCLVGESAWTPAPVRTIINAAPSSIDMKDVRGQAAARHALEIAAAGAHHLLFVGPPGAGKSMLAQRISGILPALTDVEAVATTIVHSAAQIPLPATGIITLPPFRAPHHSTSIVAMVGGGAITMRPGEISLATNGVLFLDELGEFAPTVLDALRQPLEDGVVRLARAKSSVTMPAKFLLLAATNPCPCGEGMPGVCVCDDGAKKRYLRRFSGPLLDRFDLRVAVSRPHVDELLADTPAESSAAVAQRVSRVREMAMLRSGCLNSDLSPDLLDEFAPLTSAAAALLRYHLERGRLSGRGYHRIRRVARTIADLQSANTHSVDHSVNQVDEAHVATALALRVGVHPQLSGDRS
jgi:magnesium chelatase family protein